MISIDIYTSEGILTFQEEIERFNWSVKNNDSLLFNVTVPTIGATIVLHSIDSALYDIAQGDVVIVKAPTGDEKLKVIVTSVTVLEQKGITEIACAGQGIADNPLGKGVYDLTTDYVGKATTWEEFRHPTGSEELSPLPGYGIIRENEDELLSYIWGREELMYLTPQSGIATTQKWRAITEEEATSITWQFTPDSIIDYDISPARPPVTDITTPQKIEGAPLASVAVPDNVNIVKPFYIEGHQDDAAIGQRAYCAYTVSRRGSDYNYLIEAQLLSWSDGTVTDLGTTERREILGVFTDSFVEYLPGATVPAAIKVTGDTKLYHYQGGPISVQGSMYFVWAHAVVSTRVITPVRAVVAGGTDAYYLDYDDEIVGGPVKVASFVAGSDRICKCGKNTKLVLASVAFGYTVENHFELTDITSYGVDEKTVTSVYEGHEVMWCNIGTVDIYGGMLVGITSELQLETVVISDVSMRTPDTPYRFVGAQRRRLKAPTDMFNVLYVSRYQESNTIIAAKDLYYMSLIYAPGNVDFSGGRYGHAPCGLAPKPCSGFASDMFDEGYDGDMSPIKVLVHCITMLSAGRPIYSTMILTLGEQGSQYQLISKENISGYWQYLDSNNLDETEESEAKRISLMPSRNLESADLTSSLEVIQMPQRNVLQRISMPDFYSFAKGVISFVRNKSGYMYVFENGTVDSYSIVLGSGYVPWAQRTASVVDKTYHLREGEQNAVHLPFIVAPIDRLSIPTEERGRIVVDAMFFSLYPGIELVEHKYVENLDMPALMTTVLVDVGEGKPTMRMRVIGIDLEYTGITRMRVHGIIY
jgi:hypothetical protein